jgi:histidine triad (HIT) family protein
MPESRPVPCGYACAGGKEHEPHTWNSGRFYCHGWPPPPCPFCEIVAGRAPATIVEEWSQIIAIEPLNPVTPGHTLVLPKTHVADFTTDPQVSAMAMACASELVMGLGSYNLITSKGRPATQSVFHLHLHLVPRAENDGLALPWYSGKSKAKH